MKNVIAFLQEAYEKLPSKQKILCKYILNHPTEAGNMTAQELSKASGTGPATVMRLVKNLGYDSLLELKKELRQTAVLAAEASYSTYWGMRYQTEAAASNDSTSLFSSLKVLTDTLNNEDNQNAFEQTLQLLLGARRIFVLGMRTSRPAAMSFEYLIDRLCANIHQLSDEGEFVYDKVSEMISGDILVVISSWPCTQKTIDVARLAHHLEIPYILITNISNHTLASNAAAVINTDSVDSPFTTLPAILVSEMIAYEISKRTVSLSSQRLARLDRLLDETSLTVWENHPKSE